MLLSKFENLFNFKSATCCFYWTRCPPGVSILPQMMVIRANIQHKHLLHSNTATQDLNLKTNWKKAQFLCPLLFTLSTWHKWLGFPTPTHPLTGLWCTHHSTDVSLPLSHMQTQTHKPQRNKHKCSLFCAAKTKSQSLHGGLFDTPKACTATEASKCVCAIVKFLYSRRTKQKPRGVFFSPRFSLLAFWEPWKNAHLVQKAGDRYSQCLWFPASWPSGSVHERSSSVPLFSCILIARDSWCPLLGER